MPRDYRFAIVADDIPATLDRSRTLFGEPIDPDAHGQAALLLVEALLHTLVEARTLTSAEVLTAIATACQVKLEMPQRTNESQQRMRASLALLNAIGATFRVDGPVAANDGVDPSPGLILR